MPAVAQTWVTPVTLEGTRVRLEPLDERHLTELAAVAFDDAIWRWTNARPIEETALRAWFDAARTNPEAGSEFPLAIDQGHISP